MDADLIPDVIVEAAALAVRERLDDLGTEGRDEEGTLDGSLWLDGLDAVADDLAKTALAAALGVCQVREEEGGHCARDGDVFGQPGHAFSARSWLATRSYSQPDAHLIRRLVITTPAQPITEEST